MTEQNGEESLRQIFEAIKPDTAASAEQREELRARILSRYDALNGQPANRHRRALIIRSASSLAACLMIAVAIWFFLGDKASTASASFQDVIQHILQAKSVRYDLVIKGSQQDEKVHVVAIPGGDTRTVNSDGKVMVTCGRRQLSYSPITRKASLAELPEALPADDYISKLQRLGASDGRLIGRSTKDGRDLTEYEVIRQTEMMRIWVDSATELPVKIEIARQDERQVSRILLENILWNEPVDKSLFSLDIPEGYDAAIADGNTEQAIIRLLRKCLQKSDGHFPKSLSQAEVFRIVVEQDKSYRIGVDATGEIIHAEFDDAVKVEWKQCLLDLQAIDSLSKSGKWYYCGKDAIYGNASAIVAAWRPSMDGAWRAVYGDLSVQEITEAEASRVVKQTATVLGR